MSLAFFGTDGIRGPYGGPSLNDEIAFRCGRAAVSVAKALLGEAAPKIVVGRDTRASGPALLRAFALGVEVEGGSVWDLGVAPTPCVAYAARASEAILACSITASHNPARDNGIKFFDGSGVKPSEELEQALDDAIGIASSDGFDRNASPKLVDAQDLKSAYGKAVASLFPSGMLKGKRIAIDCSNGAMHVLAPSVFAALGAELRVIADAPDGDNINEGVGSEHPDSLRALYSSSDYDFAFAFDGDGDRVILFDEKGAKAPGEALLALLASDAKSKGRLPGDVLVTTIQSNLGLDAAMRRRGISVERTDVGDKHIARLMILRDLAVGGEESGHVVLGRFAVTGDGLFAALSLAEIIAASDRPTSELLADYQAFPQSSKACKVAAKPPLEECEALSRCMAKLESSFGDQGRLLVRYSGTESKLRLLVEAKDQKSVDDAMNQLLAAAREDLQIL